MGTLSLQTLKDEHTKIASTLVENSVSVLTTIEMEWPKITENSTEWHLPVFSGQKVEADKDGLKFKHFGPLLKGD